MDVLPIAILYSVILFLSSAFAGILWYSYKSDILKLTLYLWISVSIGFVAQGLLKELNFLGFLAYAVNLSSVFILLLLSEKTSGRITIPIGWLKSLLVLGFISSCALFYLDMPYAIATIPFSIGCGIALIIGAVLRKGKSPLDWGFRILMFLSGLHFMDYPLLRADDHLAVYGFTAGLILTFCYALIIPIFVMKLLSDQHAEDLNRVVAARTKELEAANEKLTQLNTSLDSLSKENRTLLNVVVHDLNNPMNVLSGGINHLKNASDTIEESRKWTTMIERAAKNIFDTVTHVANFHLAKTLTSLSVEPVDLDVLCRELQLDYQEALNGKKLSLEYINNLNANAIVLAERKCLKNQVFANLLSNAIKFSHPGGKISITVSQTLDRICVHIKDSGVGIDSSMVDKIFSPTLSHTTFGTAGEKGLGLGLSIVNYYTRLMGGEIKIFPCPGEPGTCFELTFKTNHAA